MCQSNNQFPGEPALHDCP